MEYCDCNLRIRYAETDQMGVAYYANYFVWFEVGRAEFCRQQGFSYGVMERETDSFLVVAEASCRYKRPLRYDMEFTVRTRLRDFRPRILVFSYQLLDPRDELVFAEGETKHLIVDSHGRPKSFPAEYRSYLQGSGRTQAAQ